MSMMGEFREITPSLLEQLRDDPRLVEGVVLADIPSDEATPDMDVLLKAMPPKQREMMTQLLGAIEFRACPRTRQD